MLARDLGTWLYLGGENVAEVFHTLLKEMEKDDGLLNDKEDDKCIIL